MHDGLVYCHQGSTIYAIKPGGSKDVTDTNVVWKAKSGQGSIPTDVIVGSKLFTAAGGVLRVHDLSNGEALTEARLPRATAAEPAPGGGGGGRRGGGMGSQDYASPIAADGKLFLTSRSGTMQVVGLDSKGDVLATNDLTDGGDWSATPAVRDGVIFVRSTKGVSAYGTK